MSSRSKFKLPLLIEKKKKENNLNVVNTIMDKYIGMIIW